MDITQNYTGSTSNFFGGEAVAMAPSPQSETESVLTQKEQELLNSLPENERTTVKNLIDSIDLSSSTNISNYGLDIRKKSGNLSSDILTRTKTRDLGPVGTCMTDLMTQLKQIDTNPQSRGLFKRLRNSIETLKAQLTPIQQNVEKAEKIMQNHQTQLEEDNQAFDGMYYSNLKFYKDLTIYIISGKLKLAQEKKRLEDLRIKATSGDLSDIEIYNAHESRITQFEQLLSELESSRILCLQNAPTIRLAQANNTALIQKFAFILQTAVPAWETQMSIALNLENSRQASQAANAAMDFTNDIIRKNADMLRQGTVEAARIAEREIISTETLEYANNQLIEGIKEFMNIHEEGKTKRAESHTRKAELEEKMKNEILALMSKNPQ